MSKMFHRTVDYLSLNLRVLFPYPLPHPLTPISSDPGWVGREHVKKIACTTGMENVILPFSLH